MVCLAWGLFYGRDGIDGIDEERWASEFREFKEFKEFSEALSTFICKPQQLIFSLNSLSSLSSLNSLLSYQAKRSYLSYAPTHLNQRTNFLLEGLQMWPWHEKATDG